MYEEQICSELSICSPRQISLHYDIVKKTFQIWKLGETGNWGGGTGKEPKPSIALQQITETLITK